MTEAVRGPSKATCLSKHVIVQETKDISPRSLCQHWGRVRWAWQPHSSAL